MRTCVSGFLFKKNRKEESSVCGSHFCTYTRGYIRRRQVVGKQRAQLERRPVPTAEEEKDAADRWRESSRCGGVD